MSCGFVHERKYTVNWIWIPFSLIHSRENVLLIILRKCFQFRLLISVRIYIYIYMQRRGVYNSNICQNCFASYIVGWNGISLWVTTSTTALQLVTEVLLCLDEGMWSISQMLVSLPFVLTAIILWLSSWELSWLRDNNFVIPKSSPDIQNIFILLEKCYSIGSVPSTQIRLRGVLSIVPRCSPVFWFSVGPLHQCSVSSQQPWQQG